MKVRDVIRRLKEDGWQVVRQTSSHRVFKKENVENNVVVAGHPSDDVPTGTLSKIRRETGLPLR